MKPQPPGMSDSLYEVWKRIVPGPDYAPYRIKALEAQVAALQAENTRLSAPLPDPQISA